MRQAIVHATLALGLLCLATAQGLAQSAPRLPDANALRILVRTTIIALDHANRTGNYTVFRDLGSPAFQQANTPAKLGSIFASLRKQNLDLGPIVLFDPKFTKQPALDKLRMLRLTGFFPTSPLRVQFDLVYQWIEKRWRLLGVAIQTRQTAATVKTP